MLCHPYDQYDCIAQRSATNFLKLASSIKVREAYDSCIPSNFRHHNPFFPGDRESLMRGMEENAEKNPNKTLEIKHVLEDGDLVAVHSHVKMNPEDVGSALVHIFRFENDRVVEFWDIGLQIPKDSPNQTGHFSSFNAEHAEI